LELVTITQIGSRLWLKAASARRIALLPVEVELPPPAMDETLVPAIEVTDLQSPPME
jgi:hypothetical protein